MLAKHSTKIIISFLSLSVLTIGFLVWWLSFDLPQTNRALAGVPGAISDGWIPLQGYAWVGAPNSCIGLACGENPSPSWISFNCRNTNVCVGGINDGRVYSTEVSCECSGGSCQSSCVNSNYWVAVNENNGKLDGYAWSDNVGWIDFNPSWADIISAGLDTTFYGNCENGCNSPGDNCSACYSKTARKFYGWARVVSEADNISSAYDTGWIRLSDSIVNGIDYGLKVVGEADGGVSSNPKGGAPWGDLLGWSWNGASLTNGLGWISFNCNSINAGGCASAYQYQVSGRPDQLGILQITRVDGDANQALNVNWANPAYGATWYDVWRQSGRCSYGGNPVIEECNPAYCRSAVCSGTPKRCHFGALPWGSGCSSSADCYGSCDTSLIYDIKTTLTSGTSYQDRPLALYVDYNYIVRSCNIFGCAKTSVQNLRTTPVGVIANFVVEPICAATANSSRMEISWRKPTISSAFIDIGGNLTKYELEYCQTDINGDVSKCGTNWTPAAASCDSLAITGSTLNPFKCSENILSSDARYGSKDFYIYRVRGVADKGTCTGGTNDGASCNTNADCNSNICDLFKSGWSFSNNGKPVRICPVSSSYKEERPKNATN